MVDSRIPPQRAQTIDALQVCATAHAATVHQPPAKAFVAAINLRRQAASAVAIHSVHGVQPWAADTCAVNIVRTAAAHALEASAVHSPLPPVPHPVVLRVKR